MRDVNSDASYYAELVSSERWPWRALILLLRLCCRPASAQRTFSSCTTVMEWTFVLWSYSVRPNGTNCADHSARRTVRDERRVHGWDDLSSLWPCHTKTIFFMRTCIGRGFGECDALSALLLTSYYRPHGKTFGWLIAANGPIIMNGNSFSN